MSRNKKIRQKATKYTKPQRRDKKRVTSGTLLDKARRFFKRRRLEIRFLLTFGTIALVLLGLYNFPYKELGFSEDWFHAYLSGYASMVGTLLSFVDSSVTVSGNVLMGRFSMVIIKTCDAMEVNILLIAAIGAFPAGLRIKAVVLPLSILLLVTANVLRLTTLYLSGIYLPSLFDTLHYEIWPLLMIIVAVLIYLLSMRLMTRFKFRQNAAGRLGTHVP